MPDEQPPSTVGATSAERSIAQDDLSGVAEPSNLTGNQPSDGSSQAGDGASGVQSGKSGDISDTDSEDDAESDVSGEEGPVSVPTAIQQHFMDGLLQYSNFPFHWYGVKGETFAKLYCEDPAVVTAMECTAQEAAHQDGPQAGSQSQGSLPPPWDQAILAVIHNWEQKGIEPRIHICRFATKPDGDYPGIRKDKSFVFVLRRGAESRWEVHTWDSKQAREAYTRIESKLNATTDSLAGKLPGLRSA